nr:helix-turn-helix domain-containing protein [uncultured Pseudomonas sp.]
MNGIGPRLREERERLGMTQRVFGDIGGVEPNAQGKYESGERTPRVDYLAALTAKGVDALYVLNGARTPVPLHGLDAQESDVLHAFRHIGEADRVAIVYLLKRLLNDGHEQLGRLSSRTGRQPFLSKAMR